MRRWRKVALGLGVGVVVLLVLGGWLAVRGKQAADALTRARAGVASVREALKQGDFNAAEQRLTVVEADTSRARSATSDPVFVLAAHVPYFGHTPAAVATVADAADSLAYGVLDPLVKAGASLDPNTLRAAYGTVDVQALQDALPPLVAAGHGISQAQAELAAVDTSGTPSQVSDAVTSLTDQLDQLDGQVAGATAALRLLPPMLGADGPRRYLLAVQSNNETRGTGGLLGSWGILRVDNGAITVEDLAPRSFLDQQVYAKPPLDFGPGYAAFYGDQPGSWSSANLSPHYPYAAQLWLKMWQDRTGQKLDGVITVDPVVVSYLLGATSGAVELKDGRIIPAADFVKFTESTVYSLIPDDRTRDGYLRSIGQAALFRLLRFNGNPGGVLKALARSAGERRLLVYSAHPAEEKVLAGMAVGGSLPTGPGPVAGLGLINAAGSKADYYLSDALSYRLLGCDGSTQRTQITVTLTNGIKPGADLPDYVLYREDLATPTDPMPVGNGSDAVFAQVYTAQGATLESATLNGRPVDMQSGTEVGRPVYRALVTLPPSRSATLTLTLVEPAVDGPARTFTTPLVKPAVVHADSFECVAQ